MARGDPAQRLAVDAPVADDAQRIMGSVDAKPAKRAAQQHAIGVPARASEAIDPRPPFGERSGQIDDVAGQALAVAPSASR